MTQVQGRQAPFSTHFEAKIARFLLFRQILAGKTVGFARLAHHTYGYLLQMERKIDCVRLVKGAQLGDKKCLERLTRAATERLRTNVYRLTL
ncbi:MAG: hypothetical protein ACYS76_14695, partial [Planctomycetota bacterium]